jgi:ABC-2 type transport system permease protein
MNPLTYQVDALRTLMVQGGTSHFGLGVDLGVLVGTVTLLTAICTRLYANLVR